MQAATVSVGKYRIESIDIVRGAIMLIMAIDHTRDFFNAYSPLPTNLATTTPMLFFTRWITHFCAALFVFLSGVSVNLAGMRRTKKQLSAYLVKRGLWLIVVELVLLTFSITLDPAYHLLVLQVIWVIAISMIVLAAFIWLPMWVTAALGALLFFGHDALNLMHLPTEGTAGFLWKFFFTAVALFQKLNGHFSLLVLYTVCPWMGVMFVGYAFGNLYHKDFDPARRKRILRFSGMVLIFLFIVLRETNFYGDPSPWSVQKTTALSIISFFNVSKYPPSLLYLCMTIGPGLLALSALEKANTAFTRFLLVYGKVPFFYYILHFYLLRIINVIIFYLQGYGAKDIVTPNSIMLFRPNAFGFNLFGVYMVWLSVILLLYYPCKWFGKYRQTHSQWWLSYL